MENEKKEVKKKNKAISSSREKTIQWLEHVLQKYYTYTERMKRKQGSSSLSPPGNSVDVNGTPAGNSSKEDGSNDLVSVKVADFDIGPGLSDDVKITTLSDLLSLSVKYRFNGSAELKTEDWIVKIPPNDSADRQMAQMAQVDKREIHFYTEALPELEEWCRSRNTHYTLAVPRCIFAKYHHAETRVGNNDSSQLSTADSVLVIDDMRPKGFSMKDFNVGLTLDEAYAALREIARIHAMSWAMQETGDQALEDKWDFTYRSGKAATAYRLMLEQGFPTLDAFLLKQPPDGPEILGRLRALHPRAAEILGELLEPPPPPAPSCLTHMDFWCNNLLFRKANAPAAAKKAGTKDKGKEEASGNEKAKEEKVEGAAAVVVENGNLPNGNGHASSGDCGANCAEDDCADNGTECLILDWQMMAISRPTHDVALILFTSLSPETRRENAQVLLKYYWNVFQRTVAEFNVELPFDFECLDNEFKKSELLALLLVIGSVELALESPVTERRLMEALRDMVATELI